MSESRLPERTATEDSLEPGQLRALARVSRDFAAAAPVYPELLQVIARAGGELLGDVCSVRLVSRDGEWLRLEDAAVFHREPTIAAAFRKAMLVRPQRVDEGLIGRVLQTGEPLLQVVVEPVELEANTLPEYRFLLEKVQVSSLLLVPIASRGRCLGALSLSRSSGSPGYDAHDLRLARELADRAALPLEHALLLSEREQRVAERGLLAKLSHELRTPLNAVIGFASLLHAEKAGPLSDTQKEYLGDVLDSARHLLRLIDAALDRARSELEGTEP